MRAQRHLRCRGLPFRRGHRAGFFLHRILRTLKAVLRTLKAVLRTLKAVLRGSLDCASQVAYDIHARMKYTSAPLYTAMSDVILKALPPHTGGYRL
jgi:hypothetical protein